MTKTARHLIPRTLRQFAKAQPKSQPEVRLQAWAVWSDAREAISALGREVDDNPHGNWRVNYVAAVTLLRVVGHVLHKVDSKAGSDVEARIAATWPKLKSDPTFKQLEQLRNELLKVYEFNVESMRGWEWTGPAGTPEQAPDARETLMLFLEDTNECAVETLWHIWQWWGQVLANIEHGTDKPLPSWR